jgi:iron(III) transport system permease protein
MKNYSKILMFLVVLTLIYVPVAYLIFSLFFPNLQPTSLTSLLNYLVYSFDSRVAVIFSRSIAIGLLIALLSTSIGLALAITLEYMKLEHKNFFRSTLILPFLIPSNIIVFSWLAFLGKRGTFSSIVFPNIGFDIYNPATLILLLSLVYFPIAMLITSLGLRNLDRNQIDAGRLAKRRKILRNIILPLVKPHVLFSFLIIFVLAISEFSIPGFLRVNVYSNEIFAQLSSYYDVRKADLFSIPLIIISLAISVCMYFYLKGSSFSTISSFSREKNSFIELSKLKRIFAYALMSLLILVSVIIPFGIMLMESNFSFLPAMQSAGGSMIDTVEILIISAPIITLLGFLTHYTFKKSRFLMTTVIFPLMIPSSVLGIALINLYNSLPLPIYDTIVMVVLGYILRFLPFSVFIFAAFSPQLSESIEESAKLSGSNFRKTFLKILLPLTKSGFIASLFIISVFCLGEVGITQMVAPPGFQTISNRIDTLMHIGNYPYVASLSLFVMIVIFIFYGLMMFYYGRNN